MAVLRLARAWGNFPYEFTGERRKTESSRGSQRRSVAGIWPQRDQRLVEADSPIWAPFTAWVSSLVSCAISGAFSPLC